jgi:hypothetical protein
MVKKNKRTDCNGSCKYKEVYKIYKETYDDEWNEYFIQMIIMTGMLSFIGCSFFLYLKFYDYMSQYSMLLAVGFVLITFVFIKALPQVIKLRKLLKEIESCLSDIAANKITEYLYRILSVESIKDAEKTVLHCIDDNGNEADICISPNKSCWLENNNSVLSIDGVVSKLVFSNNGDDTGVIKYFINDKIVYAEESEE